MDKIKSNLFGNKHLFYGLLVVCFSVLFTVAILGMDNVPDFAKASGGIVGNMVLFDSSNAQRMVSLKLPGSSCTSNVVACGATAPRSFAFDDSFSFYPASLSYTGTSCATYAYYRSYSCGTLRCNNDDVCIASNSASSCAYWTSGGSGTCVDPSVDAYSLTTGLNSKCGYVTGITKRDGVILFDKDVT
ncbi:hypothetical protein GQ473_05675, partial [archaeon]|nr:hypothetical protein [archaeon]